MALTSLELAEETDAFLVSIISVSTALAAGVILNSMLTHTSPDLAWSRGNQALLECENKVLL